MPKSEKIIAVYVRVSGRSQDTRSQTPDLERWAESQDLPVRWYRDRTTGKSMDRPAWNRLEADILAGRVATVAVWRIDRLGRTAAGLTRLFEVLQTRKVNLVSLKDGLDLSTPAGRLMANVLASVAAFETEVRGERVAAGQAAARAEGKTWGGSVKGWRRGTTEERVKTVRKLHKDGESVAAIARAVGLSRPTIYNILSSED